MQVVDIRTDLVNECFERYVIEKQLEKAEGYEKDKLTFCLNNYGKQRMSKRKLKKYLKERGYILNQVYVENELVKHIVVLPDKSLPADEQQKPFIVYVTPNGIEINEVIKGNLQLVENKWTLFFNSIDLTALV
jgi:5'(3')-deoxyribonucleotidase